MNDYHTDEELEIRIHSLYFLTHVILVGVYDTAIFPEKKKGRK